MGLGLGQGMSLFIHYRIMRMLCKWLTGLGSFWLLYEAGRLWAAAGWSGHRQEKWGLLLPRAMYGCGMTEN